MIYLVDKAKYGVLKSMPGGLRCVSCSTALELGDVVYSVPSGSGKRAKRHLECALKYNVIDATRIGVQMVGVLLQLKAMVVEVREQQATILTG